MKTRFVLLAVKFSLITFLLTACGLLQQKPALTQTPPGAQVQPVTGIQYHFVTDQLLLPTTEEKAQAYALDVDGDSEQRGDNLFGRLLTLLTSVAPGLDVQSTLSETVAAGQLVSLHVVKADDPLNDSSVSWSILQGEEAQAAPAFDGSDEFTVDSAAPINAPVVGALSAGHFSGGPGAARLRLFLLGQYIELDSIALRLEVDVSAAGCANGRLGGGLTAAEFSDKLLPKIADGLNQIVQADPTAAKVLLQALDSNNDGTITIQELQTNPVLKLAISPDLDLLDASGTFNPGQDGREDSYSMGLGFTCVPASFVAPGDSPFTAANQRPRPCRRSPDWRRPTLP